MVDISCLSLVEKRASVLFGHIGVSSAKNSEKSRENTYRFLVPENAALAQGLLRVFLDKACLERFPSGEQGVAIIPLEGWQIDLLTSYGAILSESFIYDRSTTNSSIMMFEPSQPPGDLPIPRGLMERLLDTDNQSHSATTIDPMDDILTNWAELEESLPD